MASSCSLTASSGNLTASWGNFKASWGDDLFRQSHIFFGKSHVNFKKSNGNFKKSNGQFRPLKVTSYNLTASLCILTSILGNIATSLVFRQSNGASQAILHVFWHLRLPSGSFSLLAYRNGPAILHFCPSFLPLSKSLSPLIAPIMN